MTRACVDCGRQAELAGGFCPGCRAARARDGRRLEGWLSQSLLALWLTLYVELTGAVAGVIDDWQEAAAMLAICAAHLALTLLGRAAWRRMMDTAELPHD